MATKIISRALDTVGNGTGDWNIVGNYADIGGDGPTKFLIKPGEDEHMFIHRVLVAIEDDGNWASSGYGSGSALTVGIQAAVYDEDDNIIYRLTDSRKNIKQNADWGHYCYDVAFASLGPASTSSHLLVRWTFAKSGKPVELQGPRREYLAFTFNDDFSHLIDQTLIVQGYWADPEY
jgi:hypothetical protein